ncbi:MAG: sugar phosphate isomerase/epimerase [Deltaproteobacteria bacterium]
MLYGAMNFPVRPFLDELRIFSSLGFDYLELAMDPPRAHYETIRGHRDALLSSLEDLNMGLVCHLPTFLSTADLNHALRQASLKEMLASLTVAADLRARKVVLHPSYITGLGVFVMDTAREYELESLEAIVQKADELGLQVCLENLFPQLRSRAEPDDFAEILERFPTVQLTLDLGHANIGSKGAKRALEFIERFPDRIGHVHAGDNLGKRDDHLPIGVGNVQFPAVLKALKGIGYDATVTFEVFAPDRDYLRVSREKFAAMLAAL